jgi:hypothetical protein
VTQSKPSETEVYKMVKQEGRGETKVYQNSEARANQWNESKSLKQKCVMKECNKSKSVKQSKPVE